MRVSVFEIIESKACLEGGGEPLSRKPGLVENADARKLTQTKGRAGCPKVDDA
jgi:hypothetical protein